MTEQKENIIFSASSGIEAYEEKQRIKEQEEKSKHKKWVSLYLLYILVAAVIVYIFPSGSKFNYSYEMGKPWIYEALTAPGNFPILKSADEMSKDYNMLLKQYYTPYFHTDESVEKEMLKKFDKDSEKLTANYGEEYTLYIRKQLKKIYSDGIIDNDNKDNIDKLGISKIKLRQKGENGGEDFYADSELKSRHTIKEAYEQILSNAPHGYSKKTLSAYNINNYLKPTLVFEETISQEQKDYIRSQMSDTKGMVQDGQKIVDRGDIVSADTYMILNSLKHEIEIGNMGSTSKTAFCGQAICVLCILTALFLYFVLFRDFYINRQRMLFVLGMITGLCALTAYVTQLSYEVRDLSVYIIPYAMVPITISTFFDTRTALFTHLTTVLICSLIAPHEFEFLLLQILIGMICISTLKKFYQRSQLFKTVGIIGSIYILTYSGLVLTHTTGWVKSDTMVFVSFVINAILLLFSYPLIFIFEKLFNFTSDITLVELTNSNNPLLRQFSEVAPGSFQHSLQVSNLASDAADHINCNALLARAGALYHDIGKMANPIYFTENQNGFNPHAKLSPMDSVRIITNHVSDGLVIARRNSLPKQLQDFIESHHGKNPVRYFYNTYCNEHPDEQVNIADFSYKGKLPSTKEEAIVMICDSVEAASRSLDSYTSEKINDLVEKLVATQLKDGAFADAPITLKEIETIKTVLKEKLKNLYHTRIRYPELKKEDKD